MAAECVPGPCEINKAPAVDLTTARRVVATGFAVDGARVVDGRGQLRGVAVWVSDDAGDALAINAVRVPSAPAGWETESIDGEGSAISRWVVRAETDVWLVERDASTGCPGDAKKYVSLLELTRHRVRAALLGR